MRPTNFAQIQNVHVLNIDCQLWNSVQLSLSFVHQRRWAVSASDPEQQWRWMMMMMTTMTMLVMVMMRMNEQKDTFENTLLCVGLRRIVTCFPAPCTNILTYLLTYLLLSFLVWNHGPRVRAWDCIHGKISKYRSIDLNKYIYKYVHDLYIAPKSQKNQNECHFMRFIHYSWY